MIVNTVYTVRTELLSARSSVATVIVRKLWAQRVPAEKCSQLGLDESAAYEQSYIARGYPDYMNSLDGLASDTDRLLFPVTSRKISIAISAVIIALLPVQYIILQSL